MPPASPDEPGTQGYAGSAGPASPASSDARSVGGSLTGRALIFVIALTLLVIALSVPVRNWLSQRAEVAALRADISASSERIAELETSLDRWSDPAFIATQARARLQFVLPGEIGYVTISDEGLPAESVLSDAVASEPQGWHSVMWESLHEADGPPIAAKDN